MMPVSPVNELLRFVTACDVTVETQFWGSRKWMCRPGETETGLLRVSRLSIKPEEHYAFHFHPQAEEVLYVLSGSAKQWIGRKQRILEPGEMAQIPPEVVHGTFNMGERPLELLSVMSPDHITDSGEIDVSGEEPWKSLILGSGYFYLEVELLDGISVVRFPHKALVDHATIERTGAELVRLIELDRRTKLLLCFEGVEFLSTTFLGQLVRLSSRAKEAGAQLRLCRLDPNIREVFSVTNLDRLLPIFETQHEAMAGL